MPELTAKLILNEDGQAYYCTFCERMTRFTCSRCGDSVCGRCFLTHGPRHYPGSPMDV